MFVSIVVETINQWDDKGGAYENGQTVMDIGRDVIDVNLNMKML